MALPIWRAGSQSGSVLRNPNGTYWLVRADTILPNDDDYVAELFDLFGNNTRWSIRLTGDPSDYISATSLADNLHIFDLASGNLITRNNRNDSIRPELFGGAVPVDRPSAAAIASASATSGLVAVQSPGLVNQPSSGQFIFVQPFNPTTGRFTRDAFQLGSGALPELIALTDGRYAIIARDGPPTLFLLDATGAPTSFLSILDRAAPRLAALSDGGYALIGRQGDGTVALNVYTSQGVLEATRQLGFASSEYAIATIPGGGFLVSLGISDTLIFYDNSGVETRREALPPGLGGRPVTPFPDGRIAIDGTIYDPRPDFNGLTEYDGITYQIGGGGDDIISAQAGADQIHGGPGNDIIFEDSGAQGLLAGDDGDDLIILDATDIDERADGGTGNDTLALILTGSISLRITVDLLGDSILFFDQPRLGFTGFENFSSSESTEFLVLGDDGPNKIETGDNSDSLFGRGGDDLLDGGPGRDRLLGGTGNDVFVVDDPFDLVEELPDEGTDTVRTALANYALPANVERLEYTGTGSSSQTGNAADNVLVGGSGDDLLRAQQGGNDTLDGGSGNDAFFFGAAFDANDSVDGGAGNNDQIGLEGNYAGGLTLGVNSTRNVEVLAVLPGSGFGYNITSIDANVAAGQELVIFGGNLGAENNLTFDGRAETDGTFRVYGGLGSDQIFTGAGNDGIYFGPGRYGASDFIDGGAGANDQLALDGIYSVTLSGNRIQNVEVLALLRGITGDLGQYNITIADDLIAAGQTFTVFGLAVETGFTLNAAAETNGNITVFGGSGNEVITTGGGADRLFGGGGGDSLNGGAGVDTFVYDAVSQSTGTSYDRVTGFVSGTDRFDFTFTVTGIGTMVNAGTLSAASFDTNLAAAVGAGQLAVNNAVLFRADAGDLAGQTFLVVDANGEAGYQAGADYVIQLIAPPASLVTGDFV